MKKKNQHRRNKELEAYIYYARKILKRTYVLIGKEVGLSCVRIAQLYRRTDFEKNGFNADHYVNSKNSNMEKE